MPEAKGLPENAYRELEPGEEYVPYIPADKAVPETTLRSVLTGISDTAAGEILSVLLFAGLCFYLYLDSKKGAMDKTA
ncbi:MAG: hypothetical protein GF417_03605 [Candidatus Latescibacteria bacterium]|nr:hypothetical protein [bacterium]MBD3423510.1 hypothetical protein [Candidatus Latescibacterota bacterium]